MPPAVPMASMDTRETGPWKSMRKLRWPDSQVVATSLVRKLPKTLIPVEASPALFSMARTPEPRTSGPTAKKTTQGLTLFT